MAEYIYGLTKIEFGDVANDGGMGQSLTQYMMTEKDTVKLTTTDPQTKDFKVNEAINPIANITTEEGVMNIELSFFDLSGTVLAALHGGTFTAYAAGPPVVHAKYTPPTTSTDLEKSVKFTTTTGHVISIVRMKILTNLDINFTSTDLARGKIKGTVLACEKSNTADWEFSYPDPT